MVELWYTISSKRSTLKQVSPSVIYNSLLMLLFSKQTNNKIRLVCHVRFDSTCPVALVTVWTVCL
uniref:Uncharacterized protein n=1 Tax=Anguilla anguilla TaxID=7936 RepID=A0A0E9QXR6_ANGAN